MSYMIAECIQLDDTAWWEATICHHKVAWEEVVPPTPLASIVTCGHLSLTVAAACLSPSASKLSSITTSAPADTCTHHHIGVSKAVSRRDWDSHADMHVRPSTHVGILVALK